MAAPARVWVILSIDGISDLIGNGRQAVGGVDCFEVSRGLLALQNQANCFYCV